VFTAIANNARTTVNELAATNRLLVHRRDGLLVGIADTATTTAAATAATAAADATIWLCYNFYAYTALYCTIL